jgi:hypothetical protein
MCAVLFIYNFIIISSFLVLLILTDSTDIDWVMYHMVRMSDYDDLQACSWH